MLLALRVGLSKGNATPLTDELSCRVETVDGNSIPATWVVLPDGGPEGYYHALIFLNAPVLREAGRVRVLLRTHQEDLLKALLDDKVHFMRSRAGKATPTAQEDLVVMSPLPEGAPEIRTVW